MRAGLSRPAGRVSRSSAGMSQRRPGGTPRRRGSAGPLAPPRTADSPPPAGTAPAPWACWALMDQSPKLLSLPGTYSSCPTAARGRRGRRCSCGKATAAPHRRWCEAAGRRRPVPRRGCAWAQAALHRGPQLPAAAPGYVASAAGSPGWLAHASCSSLAQPFHQLLLLLPSCCHEKVLPGGCNLRPGWPPSAGGGAPKRTPAFSPS